MADNATEGTGMNMIFRPNFKFASSAEDNLLELNLTVETLQFMQSNILAKVPNRGFDNQDKVDLTGVPYMQTVSDKLNEPKGDMSNPEISIHFEQGLLMRTPPTTSPDTKGKFTISRLASIPHGTTINLQAVEEQSQIINKKPVFPDVDIRPFFILVPDKFGKIPPKSFVSTFQNMNTMSKVPDVVRKPPDLSNFTDPKAMFSSLKQLQNPNQLLTDFLASKTVVDSRTFTVKSAHDTLKGGGVTNIAFLQDGDKTNPKATKGNARVSSVECTYWISTVKYQVVVPPDDYTKGDKVFTPIGDTLGVPGPQFQLEIGKKTTQQATIDVTAPIIQYSQNVLLDFGELSWPHVSVATLAPALPLFIAKSTNPGLQKIQ